MTTITKDTPWRHMGAVPYAVWKQRITDAGGLSEYADRAVWEALGDDSALALEQLEAESSYASRFRKIPADWWNAWNLQIAGVGMKFGSALEAAKAWRARLYDPNYKQGIYTKTVTIYDLISTYAPKSDGNDPDGYVTGLVAGINRNGFDPPVTTPSTPAEPVEQEPPVAEYNYGNGVLPDIGKITVAENKKYAGYIDPANHIIRAFVIHSAYGSLAGTTGWFQGGNALTDYMVGNSSDGASLDGRLRQFNDPNGARYSWASGPVSNPIEDAAKFLEIYGPNKEVINMYTTALERSGDSRNAVTEKEHAKRVALIAYWANRYGKYLKDKTGKDLFTCDTFPLIPSENNRSFLIYHGEINADKRDSCPDSQVRATLDRIIADAKTTLAAWQKGGAVPSDPPVDQPGQYAQPVVIEALQAYKDKDTAPSFVKVGNDTFVFVNDRVRAIRNTPRYQSANKDGKRIGADINKGEEFAVLWLFFNEKGEAWYVTPYWTRVKVSDTERIKDAA